MSAARTACRLLSFGGQPNPQHRGLTWAFVVVPSFVAITCGGSGPGSPTISTVTSSTLGGLVTERTPQGDRPLANWPVKAWVEAENADRIFTTDAQGRYQLDRLPIATRVWPEVGAMAAWSRCALVVTTVAGQVTYDMLVAHDVFSSTSVPDAPGFRTISGLVYDLSPPGRRPMAGAYVTYNLTWAAGGSFGTRNVIGTVSDPEGRFRVCGLPEASGGLVIATDFESRRGERPVPPGPSVNIEIEVP
jgi:hypothetical protein